VGSVYPALKALAEERLVRDTLVRPGRGAGRPRRYYELTPPGVAVAMGERAVVAALLRVKGDPSSEDVEHVLERLERCARLSQAVLRLRRGVLTLTQKR
jgi:DNA-binding PadR family transcriptional regulator